MGFMEKRFEIGNKLEKFLAKQGDLSEDELKNRFAEFFQQHNKKMEEVNRKLGGGIGEFIHKAETLIEEGKFEDSLRMSNRILGAHPECEEALLMKAECLFHLKKPEESLECLKTLLELNPNSDQAHFQFATVMFAFREYKTALNAINAALNIFKDSFDYVILKAQILNKIGNPDYKKWIEKAKKIDPKRADNFMRNYWVE